MGTPKKPRAISAGGGGKPKRQRAIAKAGEGVGLTRYLLYRNAWFRITEASERGYHLEAITLIESILTDRMESRASFLSGANVGYQNLGPLTQRLRELEQVPEFVAVLSEIDAWREQRNAALHEMVKFQPHERPSWEEKLGPLARIVREGRRVLRAFDSIDQRERKKNGARPAATEPAAFGRHRRQGT